MLGEGAAMNYRVEADKLKLSARWLGTRSCSSTRQRVLDRRAEPTGCINRRPAKRMTSSWIEQTLESFSPPASQTIVMMADRHTENTSPESADGARYDIDERMSNNEPRSKHSQRRRSLVRNASACRVRPLADEFTASARSNPTRVERSQIPV